MPRFGVTLESLDHRRRKGPEARETGYGGASDAVIVLLAPRVDRIRVPVREVLYRTGSVQSDVVLPSRSAWRAVLNADATSRCFINAVDAWKRRCCKAISFAMSKTAGRKLHWHSKVKESFVPLLGSAADPGLAVGGGADYAEFPFVTAALGGGLSAGDVILEIGGTPVLGMTLGDVRGVISSCPHPVRIKTVAPEYSASSGQTQLLLRPIKKTQRLSLNRQAVPCDPSAY
ncbi:Membrane-associated guanylate kinase, WW and PDZ domain-containing protein 3 [Merluccius polli]|uniref:Membrane-associated guanylate kinase, WW and PDZ domain-containing protein 3 n=1 Tax=Merluccius polli TaxID=89951 RepID=A0AA47N6V0_MERPO|nr:Membrane-associated guanylate kinase, WW and PDZ domain-containing protein 3 [Merluccius polli]